MSCFVVLFSALFRLARVNFVFVQSHALFTEIFSQSECTIFGGIVDKFLRNHPSCGGKALFRYLVPMKIYIDENG